MNGFIRLILMAYRIFIKPLFQCFHLIFYTKIRKICFIFTYIKTIAMENKILGLRTTIYKVNNISKAKEWYALAFETKPYFDEPFYVGFNIGGYELGLQPEEQP